MKNVGGDARVFYTPEEVFALIGVGRTLGYKLLIMGRIPSVRMGLSGKRRGKFLIPRKAFDRWLEDTAQEAVRQTRGAA